MIGLTLSKWYKDIADAIRSKGISDTFKPSEMAAAIRSIDGHTTLWKMDSSDAPFYGGSWQTRLRYEANILKKYLADGKDIITNITCSGNPGDEYDIANFYVSDNRVIKIDTIGGVAKVKIQFGGGNLIPWTEFDTTKVLTVTFTHDYKINITQGATTLASVDVEDSGQQRSIWTNETGTLFFYGSLAAGDNVSEVETYVSN